ncbi:MAG: hypothetical protein O2990_04860 [Bacteroidetes bacterium]|nr:hypothetical protein [Bacteroidota bacterium]
MTMSISPFSFDGFRTLQRAMTAFASCAFLVVTTAALTATTATTATAQSKSASADAAEDPVEALVEALNVRHIGPGTMSGRVTAIAVPHNEPEVIFVGTASGGLWKSTSAGVTWEPIFDDQPTQSIGAVALSPLNPDLVWVGTGEGNPRNSHTSGRGLFRSLDGGASWDFMGLKDTRNIHRILIHPRDPNTVYVAATGSAWGDSPARGVYKTTDGGRTWNHILSIDNRTGCAELIMDPSNPDKLFAAMWSFRRQPWTFTSGGEGSGLYVTHDGGENWVQRTDEDGLPEGELGRMGLAMSAANPDVVYALVESKDYALYRSDDGGATFRRQTTDSDVGNRPFYYAEIHCDPTNEDHIYSLWSMVSKSTDGGRSFDIILPYSGVHPDHHALYIHPSDPNYLINGNDGGLNISRDGGDNWTFVNNLPVGQFYHIAVDDAEPYNVYGGMQDNGSWVGPSAVWHAGGIRNEDWQEVLFGDGFDVQPTGDGDVYAMYQGGALNRVDLSTLGSVGIQPASPDSTDLRFAWNAALALDPNDRDGVYYGSQRLHYSPDRGRTWETLSPDLTTNDPTKLEQATSGGLTIDATKAENHCTILCIAPSEERPNEIWVGTDDGKLQQTTDRGATWTDHSVKLKGLPAGSWIPFIHLSAHNPDEVYVVANNYRRNDWEPYLYRTTDGGKSWKRLVYGEDVPAHVQCVVQDAEAADLLFLGTEEGLYFSVDHGVNWRRWTHDVPAVPVRDLAIQEREGDLVLGTFGRAAYVIEDLSPLRALANEGAAVLNATFRAFDAATGYQAPYARPAGSRFMADHVWEGENRQRSAHGHFYVQADTAEAHSDMDVVILNEQGDTLRRMNLDVEAGWQTFSWRGDSDGIRWPSRDLETSDEPVGGGVSVAPGTYYAVMTLGDNVDTMALTVAHDPRKEFDRGTYEAGWAHTLEVYGEVERLADLMQELAVADAAMDAMGSVWAHMSDSTTTTLDSLQGEVSKGISAVHDLLWTPKDFVGYDHVTVRVMGLVYDAMPNLTEGATANDQRKLEIARNAIDKVEAKVRALMDGPWQALQEEAATLEVTFEGVLEGVKRSDD